MPNCTLVGIAEHDVDVIERRRRASPTRSARRSSRVPARDCGCRSAPSPARSDAPARWRFRRGRRERRDVRQCAMARGRRLRHRSNSPMPRNLPSRSDAALRSAKARDIRRRQRAFEAAHRIAAIIFDHDRRLIRIGFLGNHVAAAQFDAVDAHFAWPRHPPGVRARRSLPAARRRDRHRPAPCW